MPDQLSIETPELVSIDMPLAGIGSRFVALLVDMLLWSAAMLALFLFAFLFLPAIRAASALSEKWAVGLLIFTLFLLNWGYFTLFEGFWNGQTPGKRIVKIRVIQQSGRPIGVFESMARNFIRYIDQIPFFYAVGAVAMFVSRQHQRLGDLAAGTLVVRDRIPEAPLWNDAGSRTFTAASLQPAPPLMAAPASLSLPAASIARLSAADLQVIETFLGRRLDLPLEVRRQLAERIAAAITAKCALERSAGVSTETFLETVGRDLRDLARLR